jgi:hypothetical protein
MISHEYDLEDIDAAINMAMNTEEALKVAIKY